MKLQIASDLHLEFKSTVNNILVPKGDILCLVGDICACGNEKDFMKFKTFIHLYAPCFKYILHVMGNHEFYTEGTITRKLPEYTMEKITARLKDLNKKYPNYYLLNNRSIVIDDYVFVGSTLWSFVPLKFRDQIQSRMNDYEVIYKSCQENSCRKFTINDMITRHKSCVEYIKKQLAKPIKGKKYIILTHHKPYIEKNKPVENIIDYAYETDLSSIIFKSPVVLTAHGHTHRYVDTVINGVRVISNPKGYERERTGFNKSMCVEI